MDAQKTLSLTEKLIAIPSVTGNEIGVTEFLLSQFRERGWQCEASEVQPGRFNLFVPFGEPRVIFTTHTDVVPAPEQLFTPRVSEGRLYGRGACDAKGILATMVITAERLLAEGETDFGLLFVVGEEVDGAGALHAARQLRDRKIKYLVNGEPTEGKLYSAHKGAVGCKIKTRGKACHSGYPELGVDANAALIQVAAELLAADYGSDPELGRSTINPGRIDGGLASNIVSPSAYLDVIVRTVSDNRKVIEKIRSICGDRAEVEVYYDVHPVRMMKLPGFDCATASYCTDIPNFDALEAKCLLFGPGTIHVAHTDHESISKEEIEVALDGYHRIFKSLKMI